MVVGVDRGGPALRSREVVTVGRDLGIAFLGLGMQPVSRLDEIEWVPKQRYRIMGPYMTRVGTLGQRMMKQTATVQANIDYADERDAITNKTIGAHPRHGEKGARPIDLDLA